MHLRSSITSQPNYCIYASVHDRIFRPQWHTYAKKLGWCIRYLCGTVDLPLILEVDNTDTIKWWIDASFAVHQDICSHTGVTMSLGKGGIYSSSTRQKINTKSSTEAELVGVSDALIWLYGPRIFYLTRVSRCLIMLCNQDNQSAILLETNSRASSRRCTQHISIH